MKLWLISQTTNNGWDTYDAAVVACETQEEARQFHPGGFTGEYGWAPPEKVSVKLLGDADPSIERGVVLASFNAG